MFGKAKIHRFNDATETTPSTPSNNVKSRLRAFVENRNKCKTPMPEKNKDKILESKSKSASKCETKAKDKDTSKSSENKINKIKAKTHDCSEKSSAASEVTSTRSTPLFRTPSLMKYKKLALVSTPKLKPKNSPKKTEDVEALKEKIVECENKDAYIKDLSEQLEDIKTKLTILDKQKEELQRDKDKFEKEIENLKSKHNEELVNMTISFEMEISEINIERNKLKGDLAKLKEDYEEFVKFSAKQEKNMKEDYEQINENNEVMRNINEDLMVMKDKQIQTMRTELNALEKNCAEIQEKHALEIEKLKREHQKEIEDLEFELLRTMTDLQKEKDNALCQINHMDEEMRREMIRMEEAFKAEKQILIEELESIRFKRMQETTNPVYTFDLNESQFHERLNHIEQEWRQKLEVQEKQSAAILRECQAISEYNIIQCEVEKNKFKAALEDKTEQLDGLKVLYEKTVQGYKDLEIKFKDLQHEMSQIILELNDTRKISYDELQQKAKEIEQLRRDKMTYELTIKNSQITIDVLKKRLIDSDNDVEQLKLELAQNEAKILGYEEKLSHLGQELKEAQNYNEELEMQYESSIKMNRTEIDKLGGDLFQKLEDYKRESESINKQLQEAKVLRGEAMQQLHAAFKTVNQLKLDLDCLETINTQYEFEIEQSQNELEDYHMREMEWNNTKEKFEETIIQMERILEEKQLELDTLKKQSSICNQEKAELNYQYTEYYENKIKEYEEELKESSTINKKYIEMSGKYDELAQKFELLELENVDNKKKILKLNEELGNKAALEEEYYKQRDAYESLIKKYEHSQMEGSNYKVKECEILATHDSEKEMLINKIQHLENSLKDVTQKYADVLGHKKNKQKKKHVAELKNENDELILNNMDLDLKLSSHMKTIENLKKENYELRKCLRRSKVFTEDKENLGSPNRSLNSSRIESPFRERN